MKFITTAILIMVTLHIANAQLTKVEIMATGLTCSMCSNAINKQLKSITHVENVDIDLNKNLFVITLNNSNNLTPKDFKEKVEKAGFFVGSMVLYLQITDNKIADNKQIDNYVFIDTKAKTVNGITKARVLNKGYVTLSEYKKLSKALSIYPTYVKNDDNLIHLKAL